MLNEKGVRELCYVVKIDDIKPIEGKDRVECAVVGGWTIMVKKDEFKPGDLAIYFEIDSKVPEKEPFLFLEQKHYKIKTQKYKTPSGQFWSQGLIMSAKDFGWEKKEDGIYDNKQNCHKLEDESRFLTQILEVTYADAFDNVRKSNGPDKYKRMAARHPELFKKDFIKWLYRKSWGKKLLFVFFGRSAKKTDWPNWVVKTDEERIQNLPNLFPPDDTPWMATEKIDGTSTTFTLKKGLFNKYTFLVCSRNVVFDKPDKNCFYETNVYTEMAEKYNMEEVLKKLFNTPSLWLRSDRDESLSFITIQGETYGGSIQKRNYNTDKHDLKVFNLIYGYKKGKTVRVVRANPLEMERILKVFSIPTVPIVDEKFYLPQTCEELVKMADGPSAIDGEMREGLVFRTYDGLRSFKAVSNPFLLKYHQN